MGIEHTRNFCIIAHIDHGKTTLSDRLLERTGTIHEREKQDQLLDSMDLERERGITIKAHPVTMQYTAKSGEKYRLNLLDTPGHVDFAYEVSRSLAACEGALLLIDAAQGVEAQTVANSHLAHKQGLTIVPVINKIDLANADIPSVNRQLEEILAIPAEEAIQASAKMGIGIDEILEAIVTRIPPPQKPLDEALRALVFDSVFDVYRGVVGYVRVVSGKMEASQAIKLMRNDARYEIKEVGVFTPKMYPQPRLNAGDVGYFIAKCQAGADFAVTQMFFRASDYFALVERVRARGVDMAILPGIMPILNLGQVRRMAELSGREIPPEVVARVAVHAEDPAALRAEGIAMAAEMCEELLEGGAPGLHFYTLNRSKATREIFAALRITA